MCRSPASNANIIFVRAVPGGPGAPPFPPESGEFVYSGMVPEKLKKLGLAGFLFFLLKGLIWIVLFLLAWSEV